MARVAASAVVAAALVVVAQVALAAPLDPESIQADVLRGRTRCFGKKVTVPDFPTKLDFVLVVDVSGSYGNDIRTIRAHALDIFAALSAMIPDLRVGLASFVDYPTGQFGLPASGDYAYRKELGLTADANAFARALDDLQLHFGYDFKESQYEALHAVLHGHAGFTDASGLNYCQENLHDCAAFDFRYGAAKVVALTTDADVHDSDADASYPGTGKQATTAAYRAAGASVIGIEAGNYAGGWLDVLAAATSGSVVSTDTASTEIVDAIVAGIQEMKYVVTGASDCDGVSVTLQPEYHENVAAGESVHFVECFTYDGKCTGPRTCDVHFFAGRNEIGTESNELTCCKAGEFFNSDGFCRQCPAGFSGTQPPSDRCNPCGCGRISIDYSRKCQSCPSANQASGFRSDVCETCTPGTYVSQDKCQCMECPVNHYCPGTGIKIPCPIGTNARPGQAECEPITCPENPRALSHQQCGKWVIGDLDGNNHGGKPYAGLLLRNLFTFNYYAFTFQNNRTPATGNEVLAFAQLDYCHQDGLFRVHGRAYGGPLDATGLETIPEDTESCTFNIWYTTFESVSGPGNPGKIRVTDGQGWIKCPSHPQIRLEGKEQDGAQLELSARWADEWKAIGWLGYRDLDWSKQGRNSNPQDVNFMPLCPLPEVEL